MRTSPCILSTLLTKTSAIRTIFETALEISGCVSAYSCLLS